jgi:hypothetical protein
MSSATSVWSILGGKCFHVSPCLVRRTPIAAASNEEMLKQEKEKLLDAISAETVPGPTIFALGCPNKGNTGPLIRLPLVHHFR